MKVLNEIIICNQLANSFWQTQKGNLQYLIFVLFLWYLVLAYAIYYLLPLKYPSDVALWIVQATCHYNL